MSLRTRALVLLGTLIVCSIAVASFAVQSVVLGSFSSLELQQTQLNAKRLQAALRADTEALARAARDWAGWDATYNYMLTQDAEYQRDNLDIVTTYVNQRINAMLLIDLEGRIVYERGFDLRQGRIAPLPTGLRDQLSPGSPLLSHATSEDATSGVLSLEDGVVLFSAQPVVTSHRSGPVRGTLIWIRRLDGSALEELSQRTLLDVEGFFPDAFDLPPDVAAAGDFVNSEQPAGAQTLNDDLIAGYALLTDVYGEPAFVMRVVEPRTIYARGVATWQLLVGLMVLTGGLAGAMFWVAADRLVLRKLDQLSRGVHRVANDGDVATRVRIGGNDEFARLGVAFNGMLDSLQQGAALQERYQAQLVAAAERDHLTGLDNRRSYERVLGEQFRQAAQNQRPLALLLLDIDHFKDVNDHRGHKDGDRVLQVTAQCLREAAPSGAAIARLGGDEFALVLPGYDLAAADTLARQVLSKLPDSGLSEFSPPVTLSAGLAVYPDHATTLDGLELCADRALYQAKAAGRDRLVVYSPEVPAG